MFVDAVEGVTVAHGGPSINVPRERGVHRQPRRDEAEQADPRDPPLEQRHEGSDGDGGKRSRRDNGHEDPAREAFQGDDAGIEPAIDTIGDRRHLVSGGHHESIHAESLIMGG
jgi:hypothetical protein